ncbi:P-II family nitrogen regulator [Solidesulfovibrio carbinolicus]|jgi:nitrogen regulatory protein PII 2|uniref:P-II family nitrogen regulator n=2 Tax=Solidesulfovibrio TaxID=2910984 RepID=A0A4P6HKN8_9BACT|nr:P-II family nitrogen regulator [Solidesulfovibrio carbinolicus]EKO39672.1 MAG: nitrogen regulatory protein PII [Solidesulfovibrio magneticus str. Maddingley MBC34]QAZ67505.1 P-II family nitrogen regulator [Solidesulfovibrio carbinolicus]HML52730.1 P-II family nitrogen regulator [Solidesulfovibrio magneticus]
MKEIMAVIRMNKMNQTKKALADAGIPAFVAREGYGRGKGLVNQAVLDGAAAGNEEAIALLGTKGRLYPKRIISIVVPDNQVKEAVDALISVNKTGQAGDGKIFVLPVSDSVRVRTGEAGEAAIV